MSDTYKQHVSPKLITKLRILILLSLIFLGIAVWHLVRDTNEWRWALVGIALGIVIGVAMTMFDQYVWNENEEHVANTSNIFATVMLVLYIVFSISKNEILDDWITKPAALGMATSWLSFAVLSVRARRLRREIIQVLKDQFGFNR